MERGIILYAEDEPDDVFFLKRAFKVAGVTNHLEAVPDGQGALDYLSGAGVFADRERHPLPCLVLLDINMPKKGGFEVLEWIRGQPRFKSLLVVMLTSSSHPADMEKALGLAADGYLLKPSDPRGLIGVVKSLNDRWLIQPA
jgi:CheY-like chemotaxis protein